VERNTGEYFGVTAHQDTCLPIFARRMPQDKARIPQAGETVYLKGDARCIAMYLERVYTKDKIQHAQCTWTEYEMFDDELISTPKEKVFLLNELTVYPPAKS
jgi:hypothetical protein